MGEIMLDQISRVVSLGLLLLNAVYADAASSPNVDSPTAIPFYVGPLDPSLMVAPSAHANAAAKTYILPAVAGTTRWGVFDTGKAPVLHINPGDTVIIQTLPAADNQVVPGVSAAKINAMGAANLSRGPHTITGPIYVDGAEPGDVLSIHINNIVPIAYASNNSIPGKGLFPDLFPNGQVSYYHLDLKKMQMHFAPGIIVPLAPFPGLVAVAPASTGIFNSDPPGRFGGNMDLRELVVGSTLYLPVFAPGALIFTGDSHAGQGNGEIDLTAIETAFSEFNITVNLIKNKNLAWPQAETPTSWITMAYDTDLNKALEMTKQQTKEFIMQQRHVSSEAATKIMYQVWNCPISEVVNDGVLGTYCIIPKNFNAKASPLPSTDNAQDFVTVASDPDALTAMSKSAMALLKKVAVAKNMPITQVYILASFTMDCRFAPYISGDKEVHCMMPKSLWVSTTQGGR
jgi:acetamidase/formamidase